MAMQHDRIENKPPVVDLLYPSPESRKAALKRKAQIEQLPSDFANNLMFEKLAEQISPHFQYKTVAMLSELCTDTEVINYRLDIIEDMMRHPELAGRLRKVVNIMTVNDKTNIYKLSTPDCFTVLDVAVKAFEAYCECTELLHTLYLDKKDKIKSLGIKRMFDFFEKSYNSKHYEKLKAEAAALRAALTGKIRSATVAVNYDENLSPTSFGLVSISEKQYEGQGTVFDRIISLGSKNKDFKVMRDLHEREEEGVPSEKPAAAEIIDKAIFAELDKTTAKYVKQVESVLDEYRAIGFEDMYSIEYQLDFYTGAINMIENAESKGLHMCRPVLLPEKSRKAVIKGIFDPIYFREATAYNLNHPDKKDVVTNDITFDENAGFYILTGANNGGKTTFVRAVGICQAMAQAGLYVPAEYCEISLVDCIYTHFPKEEQTGIDTSRFTTEVKEFKAISDVITNHSLLLMNESIQSTTPGECVDIAKRLLRIFCVLGVRGVFATHLTELANYAAEINSDEKVRTKAESITVTVDASTGERRYKIEKGLPKAHSYAETVFNKYGLDISSLEAKAAKQEY